MRFPKIITLSLNPVADLTFYVDDYVSGEDNVVVGELYDAAGKSVDVSRVLRSYEIDNTAVVVAGRENSTRYFERLHDENVKTKVIYTPGRIRENISIITKDGRLTRLMRQSPKLSGGTLEELRELLRSEVCEDTLVVIAGRLPAGVTSALFADLCELVEDAGGIIALDTSNLDLETVGQIRPWVMKPNHQELESLLGRPLVTQEDWKNGVLELQRAGVAHVLASFGGDGMVYTDGSVVLRAMVPELSEIRSTVGAGDAALAGFIIAHDYKYDTARSVRFAAAFGTAACLVEGTNPPRRISVAMINNQVQVFEI